MITSRMQGRHAMTVVAVALVALVSRPAAQGPVASSSVVQSIEASRDAYSGIARQIWDFAEVGYQEEKSSALLQSHLRAAGFDVKGGVAGIPTAFVATYGSGRPVVGFIGEFDALPGLSQAAAPERKPLREGEPGHGCGHHLFGTGSMAAAIAVKDWLAAGSRPGTVRFFGTPAEEGGSGKVYMVRAGLFADVDVAISWHPGDRNDASPSSTLANMNAKFRFRGLSAHASSAPHRGRSALDGVEAMNFMVNLLREHLSSLQRQNLVKVGGVFYTPDEVFFAEKLRTTLPDASLPIGSQEQVQPSLATVGTASTDLGDVSWNVPTVSVTAATWVPGVPAHSWQAVACGGTSIGVKGMMVAAKTMALTAVDLFTDPSHIARAREEFNRRRGDFVYKPRVGDRTPALDYRR